MGGTRAVIRRLGRPVVALALCAAITSVGPSADGQTSSSGSTQTCRQWDVTGEWQSSQGNGYEGTFTFDPHPETFDEATGIVLTGVLTLAEWQRAGWTGPSNPLKGSIAGDHLTVVVTARHRDGSDGSGQYDGTVSEGGVFGTAGTFSWLAEGPTKCLAFELSDRDAEGALLDALGAGQVMTEYDKACDRIPSPECLNSRKAGEVALDYWKQQLCPQSDGYACETPGLTFAQKGLPLLMRSASKLAAYVGPSGTAGFPAVRAGLRVLEKMVKHGFDKDPASAASAATAAWRLFVILGKMDAK